MRLARWLVILAAGCSHWVTETTEVAPGACAELQRTQGGTCRHADVDQAVTASVGSPTEHHTEVAANVAYRWRAFEVELDERRVRRDTDPVDPHGYHSLAIGGGLRLNPVSWFFPRIARYAGIALAFGPELGVIDFDGVVRGRGSFYGSLDLELTLPDVGPFRYEGNGVPGLAIGVRRTSYVQEWVTTTSVELGLAWHWGVPIEIHRHKYFRAALD